MKTRSEWLVKTQPEHGWLTISLLATLLLLWAFCMSLLNQNKSLKAENTQLKSQLQSQYMIWEIDKDAKCFEQLKNSDILRLQIKK